METEQKLNADILKITMMIHEKFPELSKYLEEMPITIPKDSKPKITIKILKDYYNSLDALLISFNINHKEASLL